MTSPARSAHLSSRPTRLALAVHGVLCSVALASTLYTPLTQAQASAQVQAEGHTFAVPAGPLDQALQQFARTAGVNVAFDAADASQPRTRGLQGQWSTEQGLNALLAGTGFEATRLSSGGYSVRKAPTSGSVSTLEAVTVTANGLSATTEGTGAYTAPAVTIGKGEQRLRDIPQSVSIMTRQRMDEQNLDSVYDALANTTGVSLQQSPQGGKYIYTRGFENNLIQYDGVPLDRTMYGRASNYAGGTALYDRVEVLRGAAGLLQGAGSPGGAVNLVRKQPLAFNQLAVQANAGSWQRYGAQVDANRLLDADGKLRARLLADHNDNHSFIDRVHLKNSTLYGTLAYDLTPDTTVSVGYSAESLRGRPALAGLPRYSTGEELGLPTSTSFGANWNHQRSTNNAVYADLTHAFNDDWRLKVAGTYMEESQLLKYTASSRAVNPANRLAAVRVDRTDASIHASGLDASLTGSIEAFGRKHEVVVGSSYSQASTKTSYSSLANVSVFDVDNFDPNLPEPSDAALRGYFDERRDGSTYEAGLYGTLRLQVADPLRLVLGGRFSRYRKSWDTDTWNSGVMTPSSTDQRGNHFTPYAGVVLEVAPQWTAYASYADIYQPQSQMNAAGEMLRPVIGANYELGIKGEHMDGKLNTAFAVFRIDQTHRAQTDFSTSPTCSGDYYCYTDEGKVRSQGFDAEISGELARGWNLTAGYTFNTTKYLRDISSEGQTFAWYTPRHIFRLWSTYQLPGDWQAFTVGGGVDAQSSASRQIGALVAHAKGRAVWSAYLRYQINPKWQASVNFNNVFNKTYYSAIGNMVNGVHYGDPRNVMLSVRGSF